MDYLFSESVDRLAFLGRYALGWMVAFLGGIIFYWLATPLPPTPGAIALAFACSSPIILPALYYQMRFAVIARLRSIGFSSWCGLFMVLPYPLAIVQELKLAQLLPWADLSLWTGLNIVCALLFLVFFFVLLIAPDNGAHGGGIIQAILQDIEAGGAQVVTRIVPLLLAVLVIAALYNFSIYRGLNDPQSMDNAQLARQIMRGQGFTTKFLRPYAVMQLHDYAVAQGLMTGRPGDLFPADRFPMGTQRVLPDTYNAPGYPGLLSVWFRIVHPTFTQTVAELSARHIYSPDRLIPFLNQLLMFLTGLLIFGLGYRLFDERVAWMSVVAFVASDLIWKYTLTALSTSLLMFLATAILFCALEIFSIGEACFESEERSFSPAWIWALGVALLLAAACLTRFQLLILLAPLIALFGLMPRANFLLPVLIALTVIGSVLPWFWHEYTVSGNPAGSNLPQLIYGSDGYTGNEIYCGTSIPIYERLLKDLTTKECSGFRWHFEHAWTLLGSNPMILFFFASLLHGFRRLRAQAFQWLLVGCALVLIAVNNLGVAEPEPQGPWNIIVILFPAMVVIGCAFFFILLDRLNLQVRLFNTLIVVATLSLTALPMILTVSTTSLVYYSFPPYMPPAIELVGQYAAQEEWVTSDMPAATAWYADHPSLWLPDSIADFQNINDTICPSGMLYFTPVTWAQPVSTFTTGEYKDWFTFFSGAGAPSTFPLRVHTMTAPGGPEYSIWSDRPRWQTQ